MQFQVISQSIGERPSIEALKVHDLRSVSYGFALGLRAIDEGDPGELIKLLRLRLRHPADACDDQQHAYEGDEDHAPKNGAYVARRDTVDASAHAEASTPRLLCHDLPLFLSFFLS